jgi:hypothetical protein
MALMELMAKTERKAQPVLTGKMVLQGQLVHRAPTA